MTSPGRAAQLLVDEQWEPAFDALLTAWRSHRTPELERAIARLSDLLTAGLEPIDPDIEGWEQDWERRARSQRPVELGVLLPLALRLPKNQIPRRIRALTEFGPDPRIGALLVEAIEQPPLTASSNFSMWTELFASLPAHVDARVQPRLAARIAERGGKSNFWVKLENWVNAAIAKLAAPVQLPKPWKAELAALDQAIAALAKREPPRLDSPAKPVEAAADAAGSGSGPADLATVRTELEAGALADALDHLVAVWGARRSPELAALIERLGLIVDADQTPPRGKTKKEVQAAWLDAAERPRPSQIGPLLASIRDAQLVDVEARLERLAAWQPDPRVSRAMMLFLDDYMLGARKLLWQAVYDAIVQHADPRVTTDIQARHDRLRGPQAFHRQTAEGRELRRIIDAFNQTVAVEHDLTADQLEHAEAIGRALEAKVAAAGDDHEVERAMVEAIVAAWDDDGPRLVYSDWLQSKQDPRGEFMALDIALAQGKKVKGARDKLFKANLHGLYGPLVSVAGYRTTFERGLLVSLNTSTRNGGFELPEDRKQALLTDLRWATVRSLEINYDADEFAELLAHAPLIGLERLSRPPLSALQGFARRTSTVPLQRLAISPSPDQPDDDWDRFGELARVLPKLETLEIMIWGRQGGRVTPPVSCFRGALVRNVRELQNGDVHSGGVGRVDEWIERMLAARCPVPTLRVIGPELHAVVTQPTLGRFAVELELSHLRPGDEDTELVLAALRGLPRAAIERVELRMPNVDAGVGAQIDAALAGLAVERV